MSTRLAEALAHHQAGRLTVAEPIYEEILRVEPDCADAWQLLGLIVLSRGDTGGAVHRIERAIALKPDTGLYHFNLGLALKQRGDIVAAIASYRQALQLSPDLVEAHSNLGNALRETGDLDGAAAAYRHALMLKPTYTEAHINLSRIFQDSGRMEAAETMARRAVAIEPTSAIAQCHLADILHAQNRLEEAETAYRAAIAVDPVLSRPRTHLGHVLLARQDYDGAVAAYRGALAANPGDMQAHLGLLRALLSADRVDAVIAELKIAPPVPNNLRDDYGRFYSAFAYVCLRYQRWSAAAEWFAQAIAITPAVASLHYNRALALQNQGLLIEATRSYSSALDVDPTRPEPYKNLAILFLALGFPAEALDTYRKAAAACPDNPDFQRLAVTATFYDPTLIDAQRYAEAQRFAERYAPAERTPRVLDNEPDPARRLRVGYVSSDFRDHPIARNIELLIADRNRSGFEVFAYSDVERPDGFTARLQESVDIWRPIFGLSDDQVAAQIVRDRIDVLVVLAGHFDRNRPLLLARRLAPVQISFHDVTTSGMPQADYLIADRVVRPAGGTEIFTERVLRLPSIYAHRPLGADREQCPPKTGAITFGSFSNPVKLNDVVFDLWARILAAVPEATLVLKYQNWFLSADLQNRVRGAFAGRGIDPDRVEFLGVTPAAEHLAAYQGIDISLDPYPFCGATTTFESLWMGVPVVTLAGTTMMSRWSTSMLRALRLDDLVATTPEQYIGIATALAGDRGKLAALRAELRARVVASPLTDGPLRARQIERFYRAVWRRWCREAGA